MVLILFFLLAAAYLFYIGWLAVVWRRADKTSVDHFPPSGISVIIPFRNEENNLKILIPEIISQLHEIDECEIILVNDHSEDSSLLIAREYEATNPQIRVISLGDVSGKKAAIRSAVNSSRYDWIITADADITPSKNWLQEISRSVSTQKADLFILPIYIEENQTLIGQLQSLEFMSVIGVTGAMAMAGAPILCNGANLVFHRKLYDDYSKAQTDENISSGDDMFLLSFAKKKNRIAWIHSIAHSASVQPEKSIISFLEQRVRWASKTGVIQDNLLKIVSILIWLTNFMMSLLFIQACDNFRWWGIYLLAVLIKLLIDFTLVYQVSAWLCKKRLMIYFPFLSILYPFYSTLVPLIGFFYQPKWKGRRIRQN